MNMGERREGYNGEKGMNEWKDGARRIVCNVKDMKEGRKGRRKAIGWKNNKFCEELAACLPVTRHGTHRNRRVQKLFYCCLCIRCRGNAFIESLLSNNRGYTERRVISQAL
jgi:hypothetical protein